MGSRGATLRLGAAPSCISAHADAARFTASDGLVAWMLKLAADSRDIRGAVAQQARKLQRADELA